MAAVRCAPSARARSFIGDEMIEQHRESARRSRSGGKTRHTRNRTSSRREAPGATSARSERCRGRNDAHFTRNGPVPPTRKKSSLAARAASLACSSTASANLVEEENVPPLRGKDALVLAHRAGEGAPGVAEEARSEQAGATAAQFTAKNSASLRLLSRWMAQATSSLPCRSRRARQPAHRFAPRCARAGTRRA